VTLPEHLYVHVPVCRAKCAYCDFFSVPYEWCAYSEVELARALAHQAQAWTTRGVPAVPLRSLYVGGGTPTMLGVALADLCAMVVSTFGLAECAEVTVEANPESIDDGLVRLLVEEGRLTRLSLGAQSFNDDELAMLGRPHDAARTRAAAASVIARGVDLSVDLMCGLPGQTLGSWESSLHAAVATGAGHVSVYPLSLEPGTPLERRVERGEFPAPDPDRAAEMMERASELLGAEGFARYEVANYARTGKESVHNTAYWTGRPYLGIGPGAHGMLDATVARALGMPGIGSVAARVRYAVASSLESGLESVPELEIETLTGAEALREDAMLGLRRAEGITVALAEQACVTEALWELDILGLVERAGMRWRTTERGWLLGNEVFGRVWGAVG